MQLETERRGSTDNLVLTLEHGGSTSKDLIGSFTRKDHLHTLRFDLSTEEIHWSTCANCSDIKRLEMEYDILQRIQSFLERKRMFMMHRLEERRDFSCRQ